MSNFHWKMHQVWNHNKQTRAAAWLLSGEGGWIECRFKRKPTKKTEHKCTMSDWQMITGNCVDSQKLDSTPAFQETCWQRENMPMIATWAVSEWQNYLSKLRWNIVWILTPGVTYHIYNSIWKKNIKLNLPQEMLEGHFCLLLWTLTSHTNVFLVR